MEWETREVDLLVIGSGAGALASAVRAADEGLKVEVAEKAGLVGGSSAVSGGGIWIPCNHDQAHRGVRDSLEQAWAYLQTCAAGLSSPQRQLAYLETAPRMARWLDSIGVRYRCMPLYADYYPHLQGSLPGGRTMDPAPFNAARLGMEGLQMLRPTNPGQLILGRVHVDAFEARTMLAQERGAKWVLAKMLLRYYLDWPWRRRTRRDRRLTGGQALVGGLLAAARQRGVTFRLNTALQELIVEDGRVVGAVVQETVQDATHQASPQSPGSAAAPNRPVTTRTIRVRARRGVLLAAGGFERNQAMRQQHLPQPTAQEWTATPEGGNTGDSIAAAQRIGAALHLMAHSWGAPTMAVPKESRFRAVFVERSMPGCMVVNGQGRRFLNESGPYPEFQQAMIADHAKTGCSVPAWIVFDADFRARYPMGPLMPSAAIPDSKVRKSWWDQLVWKADTLEELAQRIGVDAQGLRDSAERMTRFAATGVDEDFARGGNVFDRYYGDVNVHPNPNLGPIVRGPFYAMKLWPGDIGTKGGVLTDEDARVLNPQGQAIEGLYAIGNNAASVMGPSYPGAGSTLGPALSFGLRAIEHMVGKTVPLQNTAWLAR